MGDKPLNLEQIVTSFHTILESSLFPKTISIPQLYKHIMEGLFIHFFPDTNNCKAVYNKEDIEFFLSFVNEQNKWKAIMQKFYENVPSGSLISLSKFKFHLDRILCRGWSHSKTNAKPLTFYQLEVSHNDIFSINVAVFNAYLSGIGLYLCWGNHTEPLSRSYPE